MRRMALALAALLFLMAFVPACSSPSEPPPPAAGSGDAAFRHLAGEIIEYTYKQNPSNATNLGIHKYDDLIARLFGRGREGRGPGDQGVQDSPRCH